MWDRIIVIIQPLIGFPKAAYLLSFTPKTKERGPTTASPLVNVDMIHVCQAKDQLLKFCFNLEKDIFENFTKNHLYTVNTMLMHDTLV